MALLFSYEKKALVIQREKRKKVLLAQFLSLIILIVRSTNIFSLETPEADDNRKVLLYHTITWVFFALTLKLSPIEFHQIFFIPSTPLSFFLSLLSVCFSNQSSLGNNVQTQKEKVLLLLCCFSIDWQHNSIMIFSLSLLLFQVHFQYQILNCWSYPSPCRYDYWAWHDSCSNLEIHFVAGATNPLLPLPPPLLQSQPRKSEEDFRASAALI